MRIGFDVDDTLVNTKVLQKELWKEFINSNPNSKYNENLPDNINSFDDKYISLFWDTYRDKLSFESNFKDNVSYVLHKLKEEGYELCVVTARPDYKYINLHERMNSWFDDNNIPIDTIYTNVQNKGKFVYDMNIDLLIDDSIDHCNDTINYGKISILFNDITNYNGLMTNDWLELYEIIKKIRI